MSFVVSANEFTEFRAFPLGGAGAIPSARRVIYGGPLVRGSIAVNHVCCASNLNNRPPVLAGNDGSRFVRFTDPNNNRWGSRFTVTVRDLGRFGATVRGHCS